LESVVVLRSPLESVSLFVLVEDITDRFIW
jgi:hypothetical protein